MRPGSLAPLLSVVRRPSRFVDLLPDPVGAGGHVDVLDAKRRKRVAYGVDGGAGACSRAGLSDPLDAELVGWRRGDGAAELERRELVRSWDQVVRDGSGLHLAGL